MQPVADDRVGDKPTGERIEGEQRRQPREYTADLRTAQGAEGRLVQLGLDPLRQEQRQPRGDQSDRRIEKEEASRAVEA